MRRNKSPLDTLQATAYRLQQSGVLASKLVSRIMLLEPLGLDTISKDDYLRTAWQFRQPESSSSERVLQVTRTLGFMRRKDIFVKAKLLEGIVDTTALDQTVLSSTIHVNEFLYLGDGKEGIQVNDNTAVPQCDIEKTWEAKLLKRVENGQLVPLPVSSVQTGVEMSRP